MRDATSEECKSESAITGANGSVHSYTDTHARRGGAGGGGGAGHVPSNDADRGEAGVSCEARRGSGERPSFAAAAAGGVAPAPTV